MAEALASAAEAAPGLAVAAASGLAVVAGTGSEVGAATGSAAAAAELYIRMRTRRMEHYSLKSHRSSLYRMYRWHTC